MSDLISRADAIDTVEELNRKVNDGRENDTICTSDVLRRINALPSADRPTGEWVGDKCSICGTERAWYGEQPNYCPDCGAKMRGENSE